MSQPSSCPSLQEAKPTGVDCLAWGLTARHSSQTAILPQERAARALPQPLAGAATGIQILSQGYAALNVENPFTRWSETGKGFFSNRNIDRAWRTRNLRVLCVTTKVFFFLLGSHFSCLSRFSQKLEHTSAVKSVHLETERDHLAHTFLFTPGFCSDGLNAAWCNALRGLD